MPSPLRSMTGFARSRKTLDSGEIIVSVKSLNHRGLDVQVHAPSAADEFENAIRSMVKGRMVRAVMWRCAFRCRPMAPMERPRWL